MAASLTSSHLSEHILSQCCSGDCKSPGVSAGSPMTVMATFLPHVHRKGLCFCNTLIVMLRDGQFVPWTSRPQNLLNLQPPLQPITRTADFYFANAVRCQCMHRLFLRANTLELSNTFFYFSSAIEFFFFCICGCGTEKRNWSYLVRFKQVSLFFVCTWMRPEGNT